MGWPSPPKHLTAAHGEGWVCCTVVDIDEGASVILVDEAPYVDPNWFYDTLLPRMQDTPSLLVGTHTSDVNYYAAHQRPASMLWRLLKNKTATARASCSVSRQSRQSRPSRQVTTGHSASQLALWIRHSNTKRFEGRIEHLRVRIPD
jgi:hypothetical protein